MPLQSKITGSKGGIRKKRKKDGITGERIHWSRKHMN
jgi:hypothetical protein